MDGRVCCGIDIATDGLGECCGVLVALFVLFDEISRVLSVEALPAAVSGAGGLGSSLGFAACADEAWFGHGSGCGYNGVDDSDVARQRRVDLQLGVGLANMVHGGNGTTIWRAGEITEERTAWSQDGYV